MSIPIKNIYYLLSYAWNKLDEMEIGKVSHSDYDDLINLMGRVLVNGCNKILKRGIDRNYIEQTELYLGIKGKLDFRESLKKNILAHGRAFCEFDVFQVNILLNKVLKSTLYNLTKYESIEPVLLGEIWKCYYLFSEVEVIRLNVEHFNSIRIHRNNSQNDYLIKVCKLIFDNCTISQEVGEKSFMKFNGTPKMLASLFESFVRNFYAQEQSEFNVFREDINWNATPHGTSNISRIPKMQTDISLESIDRKIIIETKFYEDALVNRYDGEKYYSGNLYQLYAYLKNIETKEPIRLNEKCEGILLYPTVSYSLNDIYIIDNHTIKICTIDLQQDWENIKTELLNLIHNNEK